MIVHFGVAAGRPDFCLEHKAKNIMDFRCPDERGNTPIGQLICDKSGDCLETSLKIDDVCQSLKAGGHQKTRKSNNAGEYICNYMFYRALQNIEAKKVKGTAVFVHVPAFNSVAEEDQHKFAQSLLVELSKCEI